MAPSRFYFVGIQLLILSHMAKSFILLTANMEDVKKIAQKFVSNSLAEKIAEFVAKATEQMVSNVSAENEQNADDIQYLTDEHEGLQHIVRQREETTSNNVQETSKYVEFEKDYRPKVTDVTTEKYNAQAINWEKEVKEIAFDKYSKESEAKDNEQKKENDQKVDSEQKDYDQKNDNDQKKDYEEKKDYDQKVDYEEKKDYDQKVDYDEKIDYDKKAEYDQQKADYEQSKLEDKAKIEEERKIAYEQQNYAFKQQLEKQKHSPQTDTKDHAPNKQTDKKHDRYKIRKPLNMKYKDSRTTRKIIDSTILYQQVLRKLVNRGHRLASFDSEENANKTKSTFRGFNIQRALTTEKARTEFDQYDNPNYPKSEYIATSGPVALPKVAMVQPWWEKEMTMPV